jgi:hypothetical protein
VDRVAQEAVNRISRWRPLSRGLVEESAKVELASRGVDLQSPAGQRLAQTVARTAWYVALRLLWRQALPEHASVAP